MGVGVAPENASEEGGTCREDNFVGLDLFVVAGKGDVEEVLVVPKLTERCGDVRLKIVPPQAELFRGHFQAAGLIEIF